MTTVERINFLNPGLGWKQAGFCSNCKVLTKQEPLCDTLSCVVCQGLWLAATVWRRLRHRRTTVIIKNEWETLHETLVCTPPLPYDSWDRFELGESCTGTGPWVQFIENWWNNKWLKKMHQEYAEDRKESKTLYLPMDGTHCPEGTITYHFVAQQLILIVLFCMQKLCSTHF